MRNYQKEMEQITAEGDTRGKRLLLHSCCAPCSSYVLTCLRSIFRITVFYYNPNITEHEEYRRRAQEQRRLIEALNREAGTEDFPITMREGAYEPERFFDAVRGLEACPEGGERCLACYELRLNEACELARKLSFDYAATTLTISPMKSAEKLNGAGERAALACGVSWLPSDFKKKDGYRRSVELSGKYGLYRQDYCGCVYSRAERERKMREKDGKDSDNHCGGSKESV